MDGGRETTVVFADVSGSTKLYEVAGDAVAHATIGRCLAELRRATESAGGRVVKTIGDEIMALFPTPDSAANAVVCMQGAMETLPPVGDLKLGLRVGFHRGPVLQEEGDVFGDTVNTASRLVEQAVRGQIITSEETAARLGPIYRAWTRRLYPIEVRGKAEQVVLWELVWRAQGDVTQVSGSPVQPRAQHRSVLRLRYGGKELVRRREVESISLGREGCDLIVSDTKVSRQHCTIERRQDKFVLKDHSTNGTYVTIDGDSEVLLQREELVLRRKGWIALGLPRTETAEIVEYFVE